MQELLDNVGCESQSSCISRAGMEGLVELNTVTGEKIGIDFSGCNQNEVEFFHKIKVLLEGEEIFKKFGTSSSMT